MGYKNNIIKQTGMLLRKNYIIIMSFFLPVITLTIAYITCGIYPFGKWDLLIIDLYHQYAPFISDFQERLKSFSSLLYSWSGGLGTNYLPLYAYYLASPLNLITILFPKEFLAEAVLVLTLLKVGLAGACFAFYLKGVHNEQNLSTVAFSLLYALSGYVLAFSWNIMWMDAIYLLPLIILGLVRLVRDSRGFFYCITLAVALLSNFYIAFFICFFVLLYYPVCLFQYNSIKKPALLVKKTAKFAGFSLLSGGLSATLLLPTFFALKTTSAAGDVFPKTITHYFDLFDYITRHFTAAPPSIREGMPNLYCGIIVLILIPIYFLSKSIKLKEKLWHLVLLAMLVLSFNINILSFIWHGFHYPNQVPYRFSFVYIFLFLSMCYDAFKRLDEFTGKQIGAICMTVLGLVIISQKFDDLSLEYTTLYSSIIFIILYAAAFNLDRSSYKIQSSKIHSLKIQFSHLPKTLFIFLVIAAEVVTSTVLITMKIDSIEGYSLRDGYSSGKEVTQIREWISNIEKEDKDFYRMEILPPKTTNDPYLYNYRGLSMFSSTLPEKTVKMFENLGYHSNSINSYEYEGSTAILDSLFGIKYLIYRSPNIEEHLYRQIEATDEMTVFKNPYALSLGFQTPDKLKKFYSTSSNPFDAQNSLVNYICGIKDILIPIEQERGNQDNLTFSSSGTKYYSFNRTNKEISSTARIKFKIEKGQQVYLYYKAPYDMKGSGFVNINVNANAKTNADVADVNINVDTNTNVNFGADSNIDVGTDSNIDANVHNSNDNNNNRKVDFNPKHSSIINLGFCESGTSLEFQLYFEKSAPESGRFEIYACSLNQQAFENAISLIKEKSMTVEGFTDTRILGHIESSNDGLMVMTIPYNKGWHVKINNQKVETLAVDDCLLAFDLPAGSNSIELRFVPEKFYIGGAITLVSILILVLLFAKKKR
jgi:uncharacterized membrane protein YfhO